MPRYLVERVFGEMEQEAMQNIGTRMKRNARDAFPNVTWEHSHVVTDESGIKTYCVYAAPDEQSVRDHGAMVREQTIVRIYEIAGDITPADFSD